MRLPRRFSAPFVAAVLGVTLVAMAAGCTSIGPGGPAKTSAAATGSGAAGGAAASSQSKPKACAILSTSMGALSTKLSSEYASFTKDPKTALTAIQGLSDAFNANVKRVTEPGALALANKANADLSHFVADAKEALAHPITGIAKVQADAPTLEADFTKVGTYCG